MLIEKIKFTHFRSWSNLELDFSPITVLLGKNGVGKTNIIEAIYMLSTGRSWRTRNDLETIQWEADFSRIEASSDNEDKIEIEMVLQRKSAFGSKQLKVIKINGVKHRTIDVLGQIPAVLFSPEAIELLDGPPSKRRRFLDIMLSEIDRSYALTLLEYNKVLAERNKLLMHINSGKSKIDELNFWNNSLVNNGVSIIKKRQDAVNFFNKHLEDMYDKLSTTKEKLQLKYKPSVEDEKFDEYLQATIDRDIRQSNTSHGPHRDDWRLFLNDRDITLFGSRGEYRTAILALKLAELSYLKEQTHKDPVLLLDDIFSELDKNRREQLSKIVQNQQTIITTTDLEHISKKLQKIAKIIQLNSP